MVSLVAILLVQKELSRFTRIINMAPFFYFEFTNPLSLSSGMNKMVINHLEKLFITSDAATIIRETDVHHPAAKMIA